MMFAAILPAWFHVDHDGALPKRIQGVAVLHWHMLVLGQMLALGQVHASMY